MDKLNLHPGIPFAKEEFMLLQFCILFQKHSYFLRPFNEKINIAIESGLIEKWSRSIAVINTANPNKEITMRMKHFYGCLIIAGTGYTASIVVFLIECYIGKRHLKNVCIILR